LTLRRNQRNLFLNKTDGVEDFLEVCDLAKASAHRVQIYTVAFEAPDVAAEQMSECASTPGHFYQTSGSDLISVFESIAGEVGALRLTQ